MPDFLTDFHHTTTFGASAGGGIDRQAGTPEHGAVRAWFRRRAEELGMTISVDAIGNQFASIEWIPGAPHVFTGSHLDSQPVAGRFDGTYGVVASLHAAASVAEDVASGRLVPTQNLTVVDWFNEEGCRFEPSLMGSSVFTGARSLEDILAVADNSGVTVAQALEETGCRGTDAIPPVASYVELHIEQGRRLERAEVQIGAVTGNWCTRKVRVTVIGEQSHTGATLMSDRRDALAAASEIVLCVERLVGHYPEDAMVTSVGRFTVGPDVPGVVPGRVELSLDLRSREAPKVIEAWALLRSQIEAVGRRRGVTVEIEDFDLRDAVPFPESGVELTEKAAAGAGVSCMRLETMAGHDAISMNRVVPTALMFVPSVGGVSHCEREFTADADLATGLEVLTRVVGRLVEGAPNWVDPAAEAGTSCSGSWSE
ncbi:M20 family metallo-hydrolase [Corynebacterium variabile]|uniref:M20 family metallo-hydrolase n=1 Tax=Corynebacterium variabile TaxID=1727 RepID=UPI003FD58391